MFKFIIFVLLCYVIYRFFIRPHKPASPPPFVPTKKDDNHNRTKKASDLTNSIYSFNVQALNRSMQILSDSINLIESTTNAPTFFSRLDLIEETLYECIQIEKTIILPSDTTPPSQMLQQFTSQKTELVHNFIHRSFTKMLENAATLKTEKGRQNRYVNFFSEFDEYQQYLNETNLSFLNSLKQSILVGSDTPTSNSPKEEISTQDAQSTKPNNTPLSDSEKVLLKYLDGHQVGKGLPNYFTYPPHNLDVEKCIQKFLDCGYLEYAPISYVLSRTTITKLKEIAKYHNVKVSGKKQDIVDTLLSTVDENQLSSHFDIKYYAVTKSNNEETIVSDKLYDNRNSAAFPYIGSNPSNIMIPLGFIKDRQFDKLFQYFKDSGKNIPITHADYQSYFQFLDMDLNVLGQPQYTTNEIKYYALFFSMLRMQTESAKTVIDHFLNIDIPFGLLHTMIRLPRSIDDILSRQSFQKYYPYYKVLHCNDKAVCDRCRSVEGKKFKIANAQVGVNYPPFFDCNCECCRCHAVIDYD